MLAITLGLLANMVVATACTLWAPYCRYTGPPAHTGSLYPEPWRGGPDGEKGWWSSSAAIGYIEHNRLIARGAEGRFNYWKTHLTYNRSSGWPFLSFHSTITPQRDGSTGWNLPLLEISRRGMATDSLTPYLHCQKSRRIAIVPDPLGTLFNTLFYAAFAMWALTMRRIARIYRSRAASETE